MPVSTAWHDRVIVHKPTSSSPDAKRRSSSLYRQLRVHPASESGCPTSAVRLHSRRAVSVQALNTFRPNDSSSTCSAWRILSEKQPNSRTAAFCKAKGGIRSWLLAWHVLLLSATVSTCYPWEKKIIKKKYLATTATNNSFNFLLGHKQLHHYYPPWAEIQLRNWDKELDTEVLLIKMEG